MVTYTKKQMGKGRHNLRTLPIAKTAVDKKQNKDLSKIKKILKAEVHEIVQAQVTTNIPSDAPLIVLANTVAVGDLLQNRTGDKIKPISHTIRWTLPTSSIVTTGKYMRILVLVDKQPSLSLPNAGNIFQNLSVVNNDGITINSPINFTSKSTRFKVLHDKVHNLNQYIESAVTGSHPHGKIHVRNKDLWTYTQAGATGVVGECLKNNVIIVATSDTINAGAQSPQISWSSHMRFYP